MSSQEQVVWFSRVFRTKTAATKAVKELEALETFTWLPKDLIVGGSTWEDAGRPNSTVNDGLTPDTFADEVGLSNHKEAMAKNEAHAVTIRFSTSRYAESVLSRLSAWNDTDVRINQVRLPDA